LGRTVCTETQCLYKGALYLFFFPVIFPTVHAARTILLHRFLASCLQKLTLSLPKNFHSQKESTDLYVSVTTYKLDGSGLYSR